MEEVTAHLIPRWQISGLGRARPWSLLAAHLCPSRGHAQRTCESIRDRGPMGLKRPQHQPGFEFLCFASLPLFLKNGFSVWGKLVKNREHLYRERCSWHACPVPFMLLKSVSVQCFCLLVFLMAQFPPLFAKVCHGNSSSVRVGVCVRACVHTHPYSCWRC